jgi:hypothetical protein
MSIKLQVYLKFLIISTILSLNQILIDTVKLNLLGPDFVCLESTGDPFVQFN